jgi:hypothetical protein
VIESPNDKNLFQLPRPILSMRRMHGHTVPPDPRAQNHLGQAIGFATTFGLLLSPPQQVYFEACPVCGNHQPAGGRFCSNCGIRLRCPSCGTSSLGKNYCHVCGQALKP